MAIVNDEMREEIRKAVEVLRSGGLILYPTDTVWGVGCDATNANAVDKVFALKKSVDKKGMIILVDSIDRAALYVSSKTPHVAWDIMEMSDKPTTLILPGAHGIASNLIPEEGTVGIRVPNHEFCQALVHRLGRPLVSTSANISGEATPKKFVDISEEIISGVDMVIDSKYERGSKGKPSSIIYLDESGAVGIIRE